MMGGSETITTIVNTRDGKTLPVPNYYWKALLKVTWSGDAISVDQIEAWTGFDLFANLPSALQTSAEVNTNWTVFQNFR